MLVLLTWFFWLPLIISDRVLMVSVRMSAGIPLAIRMSQNLVKSPQDWIVFWQLIVTWKSIASKYSRVPTTEDIRLPDISGNWMVKTYLIAKWFVNWMAFSYCHWYTIVFLWKVVRQKGADMTSLCMQFEKVGRGCIWILYVWAFMSSIHYMKHDL